jgi:hypothetical protein
MRFKFWIAAGLTVLVLGFFATVAGADEVTGSGSVVMNDKFHTKNEWGANLVLPREGKITRVMDGTYGFDIKTVDGVRVASFIDPQQAVGMSLPAGTYVVDPYVCTRHRHHHIEVTATY